MIEQLGCFDTLCCVAVVILSGVMRTGDGSRGIILALASKS